MQRLQEFEAAQIKTGLPHFKSGDTVRVHCKVKEGNKERIQIFEGVVLKRHNKGISSSFTVRKVSHGIGVERVFPLHAPFIEQIEVVTVGKVRQSRIYYLRERSGKKARIAAVDTRGKIEGPEANGGNDGSKKAKASSDAADESAPSGKVEASPAPPAEDKASEDKAN